MNFDMGKRLLGGLICLGALSASAAGAGHFGLFVGLNQYDTSYVPADNFLNYCVPDAGSMLTNLVNKGGGWVASNTTLLVNSSGTKTAIRSALSNYAAKAVSGDVVVYFHSSHGGNDDATQANVYLCAYDADYAEDELATDLLAFKTGVKLIAIVDACHSGGLFVETSMLSRAEKEARRQTIRNWDIAKRVTARMKDIRAARIKADARRAAKLIAPDDVGWMTACAYDEYSYEDSSIGHGWFTYRLLQGFDYGDSSGDGWASFQELFDFACLRIPYLDQVPQDCNPSILATLAGNAGATPAGDAWDYDDNVIEGAPSLFPSGDLQTTAVHTLRQNLDESDFFAIPVRKNRCYTFRSANTAGGGDVDAELYTGSGETGARLIRYAYDIDYPDNLEFEMVYKAFATGTVYLRVKPYFSSGTNLSYALQCSAAGTADSMATLSNGVPKAIASIAQGSFEMYRLPIPAGQTNLAIRLSGDTGDADLYVGCGYIPLSGQDYYSQEYGNTESIDVVNPPANDWFIQVYGYEASSNLTLVATCTPGAATIGSASNTATNATFSLDLTNGARVSIYSATNLLPAGHWHWALRSNAATVVNGKVNLNLISNAPGQIISIGKPLDF